MTICDPKVITTPDPVGEEEDVCTQEMYLHSTCLPFHKDGKTSDRDNLLAAIRQAIAEGKTLVMQPGVYLLPKTAKYNLAADEHLGVILSKGAVLKAGVNQQVPVLAIDGDRDNSSFDLSGRGDIDVSEAGSVAGAQGATGLQLRFIDRASVKQVRFVNAKVGYADKTGDSGITANSINHLTVSECHFFGCDDSGIYMTGSALPDDLSDDGGTYTIDNNYFHRCRNDVSVKRQFRSGQYTKNYSKESLMGLTLFGANQIPSGVNNIITNNVWDRTASPVRIRTSHNTVVNGNIFIDWGMTYLGDDYTNNLRAISVDGVYGAIVTGNVFDATNTKPAYAIEVRDYTYEGVVWLGGSGRFDNVYNGCDQTKVFADINASRTNDVQATGHNMAFSTGAVNSSSFITLTDSSTSTKTLYKGSNLLASY